GVGPSEERKGIYKDLADFVLAPFARDERADILALMPQLTATVETWLHKGIDQAMNIHNRLPASEDEDKGNWTGARCEKRSCKLLVHYAVTYIRAKTATVCAARANTDV